MKELIVGIISLLMLFFWSETLPVKKDVDSKLKFMATRISLVVGFIASVWFVVFGIVALVNE